MNTDDSLLQLCSIAVCLFLSFLFSVISVATDGWSNRIDGSFAAYFATDDDLLWVVGCMVFIILGIICLCVSAIILMARFFNHGKGRTILGGVLSIFAAVVFLVAIIIFMTVELPYLASYGYSYALLWVAIPFAVVAGIMFFMLKDSEFLM